MQTITPGFPERETWRVIGVDFCFVAEQAKGELRELLRSTGFSNVRVATQPMPTRFVMLAEK